jgi:REP element-mobilizing transposase RayT
MHEIPQRKSPRLKDYDYSQSGAYFVTICTHQRQYFFGEIRDEQMHLSIAGKIVAERWHDIPNHYPNVELDAFVVMPNHLHGIVVIHDTRDAFKTYLGRVINAYKGAVTAQGRRDITSVGQVWQARYYDHIIRNEPDLQRIREYIEYNPARWEQDKLYGTEQT